MHRPELSLQRLTPSNHDDLLFDDVRWGERAQHEDDQCVAKMRERDVEVFLLLRRVWPLLAMLVVLSVLVLGAGALLS